MQQCLTELAAEQAEAGGPARAVSHEEVAQKLGLKSVAQVRQRLANAEEAKDLMVQFNMRLVLSLAKKYVGRCVARPL